MNIGNLKNSPAIGNPVSTNNFTPSKILFKWVIENFDSYENKVGFSIRSSDFRLSSRRDIHWQLTVFPMGEDMEAAGYVSLYLRRIDDCSEEVNMKCNLSIVSESLENSQELESRKSFRFSHDQSWGSKKFILRSILFDHSNEFLLPDNDLTMICKIEMLSEGPPILGMRTLTNANDESSNTADHLDYFEMLHNSIITDMHFLVEGRSIETNQIILMSNSHVFMNILCMNGNNDMAMISIELPGVKFASFVAILTFIYTKELRPLTVKLAIDVYILTKNFQLIDLRNKCLANLSSLLTSDNVIKILRFAEAQNAFELKDMALNIISENGSTEIMKTSEWKVMISRAPHLMNEFLEVITNYGRASEKRIECN